jgi:peptidoglycan/xylan/chitin deacetylase (PgdA/CDA1 family)
MGWSIIMKNGLFLSIALFSLLNGNRPVALEDVGRTEILKWPNGSRAAISLTYDDGSVNQFRVAVPIMKKLGFPATFHIVTGRVRGSKYTGKFIGRPVADIIAETASVPTGRDNFFERASAIGHLGLSKGVECHGQAGELFEDGKIDEAYRVIDEAYAKARSGAWAKKTPSDTAEGRREAVDWDELGALAREGFEISSHTVTHPRLAVLDEANLVYELEKSRQEIFDHLGSKHTFTIECPFGTEDERVMSYALARYPASRNRMPEPWLEELNRASDEDPLLSNKEYVQWQRGALTGTPMALMKSWVDTVASRDNMWLVLVFHGVDGIGWEPKTGAELGEYFGFIKSLGDKAWIATFQDAAKYMRERMHGKVLVRTKGEGFEITLMHDLPRDLYDLPLTLRTAVPDDWPAAEVRQGARVIRAPANGIAGDRFILYDAVPNSGPLTLSRTGA